MRCFNNFQDDRTCDICESTQVDKFLKCKENTKNRIATTEKLYEIKSNCPHKTDCYDEYTPFDGCNKNGKGLGRFAEECNVTLECEKYCL